MNHFTIVGTFMAASLDGTGMALDRREFEHPSWIAAAGTGVGYLLLLALLTVALFLVPWAVFVAL